MSNSPPDPTTERDRLIELVHELGRLSASPLPFEGLVQAIVESVQRLTRATGAVLEVCAGDDELFYRNVSGSIAEFAGLRLARGTSLSGLCVAQKAVMYTADATNDPRVNREAAARIAARSMMVVPLLYGTKALGVLKSVSSEPDAFDTNDERALTLAAQFIAGLLMRHGREGELAGPVLER